MKCLWSLWWSSGSCLMKILASAIVQLIGSSEQESQARFQREPLTIQDLNCPEYNAEQATQLQLLE